MSSIPAWTQVISLSHARVILINSSFTPYSALSETVGVEVVLKNPLKIPLNLTDLLLLWEFNPEDNTDSISNEVSLD